MARSNNYLSKTGYLEALSCPKLLWYRYNRPETIPPDSGERIEIIKQGRIVGEYAQKLFPEGIKIERLEDPEKMNERSVLALADRKPLFEAGFTYKNSYALSDILLPAEDNSWDMIEVKSSTGLKEEYLYDAAFQKYVYQGRGIKIRRCYLMFLNNQYVRQGKIELDKLFAREDISAAVDALLPRMDDEAARVLNLISGPEPDIKVGEHCTEDCPLDDLCWQFLPEGHVFVLRGKGRVAFDLMERGILKLKDIPADYELNERHAIQVQSHNSNLPFADKDSLRIFLEGLDYPLYFLDFETIGPAIPVYDNSRPYQDIVFQYSLHVVESEGAKPIHYSYLAAGDTDPRPEVIKRLKQLLGNSGSILAYNANYEKGCIKSMVDLFPEYYAWLENTVNRFVDLLIPFRKYFYYHPAQEGKASMKKVLPALTGISYDGMTIGNGGAARFEYMRVTFEKGVKPDDRQKVRDALEKYCSLDTSGMIEILQALKEAVYNGNQAI